MEYVPTRTDRLPLNNGLTLYGYVVDLVGDVSSSRQVNRRRNTDVSGPFLKPLILYPRDKETLGRITNFTKNVVILYLKQCTVLEKYD